ncbi:uncharacterized protein EV154DRAFT_499052 [Mucor mucedo]|uniref:uncharacterized protein n=1 Tax=Mucor mucedo TaxID=29922 RepID=UPI00221F3D19|nr:uncharacterized protein EV154DRAFT_499052 [Mucor mucedo]KAI7894265.1 hypothetical protein EV154DRAFT_499052 [Mucor mucedo]
MIKTPSPFSFFFFMSGHAAIATASCLQQMNSLGIPVNKNTCKLKQMTVFFSKKKIGRCVIQVLGYVSFMTDHQ